VLSPYGRGSASARLGSFELDEPPAADTRTETSQRLEIAGRLQQLSHVPRTKKMTPGVKQSVYAY
jgi:hypothetical protein